MARGLKHLLRTSRSNKYVQGAIPAVEGTEFRATTKRGYRCASVAVRARKRATKSDKLIVLFSETETAKQNKKFPFHFFFRLAAEGGRRRRKNARKFLGFAPRELVERGRGASVIRQNPADFVRNTFELRPIHTASHHLP